MITHLAVLGMLTALLWMGWPTASWAAPHPQTGGTVPTVTPEPIFLTLEDLAIAPVVVVAGDAFEISFRVRNNSTLVLETLSVTLRDVAADYALIGLTGNKNVFLTDVGPGATKLVSRPLLYDAAFSGETQIAFDMSYTYTLNGESLSGFQSQVIGLQVLRPTPTPTVTVTPTPTPTAPPTPDANATATAIAQILADALATSLASTPVPDLTATEVARSSAEEQLLVATETVAAPPHMEAVMVTATAEPTGAALAHPAVIVEFVDAPREVVPGDLFTMTLTVRTISTLDAVEAVVVEWQEAEDAVILPIGTGTRWSIDQLQAGASYTRTAQFYVLPEAMPGIQRIDITVTYQRGGTIQQTEERLNLLVQLPVETTDPSALTPRSASTPSVSLPTAEPAWLRVLRALFGIFVPTRDTE
jgi:hypothetical protein